MIFVTGKYPQGVWCHEAIPITPDDIKSGPPMSLMQIPPPALPWAIAQSVLLLISFVVQGTVLTIIIWSTSALGPLSDCVGPQPLAQIGDWWLVRN